IFFPSMTPPTPIPSLFPYTTLFRSLHPQRGRAEPARALHLSAHLSRVALRNTGARRAALGTCHHAPRRASRAGHAGHPSDDGERRRRRDRPALRVHFRLGPPLPRRHGALLLLSLGAG